MELRILTFEGLCFTTGSFPYETVRQHLHGEKEIALICFSHCITSYVLCKVNLANQQLKSIQGTDFIAFKNYIIINLVSKGGITVPSLLGSHFLLEAILIHMNYT